MKTYSLCVVVFFFFACSFAQTTKDSTAIIAAALDYADGFYSGDAVRMERALYPDFNKGKFGLLPQSGRRALTSTSTYSGLIEGTRAKVGLTEETKRKLSVSIIHINEEIAQALIISANFNDYVQMVKSEGQWKIINVLWTDGLDSPNRIKNFIPEDEQKYIVQSSEVYMNSIYAGDVKRLESVICPEFNKVSMLKEQNSGKLRFQKQKYSSLVENVFAKIGSIDEPKRVIKVRVIDCLDGIAISEIETRSTYEYVQMFKSSDGWKIFNVLVQPHAKNSFVSSLPAIVNHPMPEFSLPIYGGGEFSLTQHKGKNILLIFPRGSIGNNWCTICQYGYVDMIEREKLNKIQNKYNLEIVFVMPYTTEKITAFLQDIPNALIKVEKWKNPAPDATPRQKESAETMKKVFQQKYEWKKEDIAASLPILVDSARIISKRLQLFTAFWDGISAEQNIPAVYILDKQGSIIYKYISQATLDRPTWDVLESFLKKMVKLN